MNVRFLQVEQPALDIEPTAVAAERSSGRDHAMAGHNDGDRIPVVRHPDGTKCVRMPDGAGDLAVGTSFPVRDVKQSAPAPELKVGAAEIERDRKLAALARKVFVKLAKVARQRWFGFAKLNRVGIHPLHPRFKFETHQALCRGSQEQRPDRRTFAV